MTDLTSRQLAETIVRGLHENWKQQAHLRGAKKKRGATAARTARRTQAGITGGAKAKPRAKPRRDR